MSLSYLTRNTRSFSPSLFYEASLPSFLGCRIEPEPHPTPTLQPTKKFWIAYVERSVSASQDKHPIICVTEVFRNQQAPPLTLAKRKLRPRKSK